MPIIVQTATVMVVLLVTILVAGISAGVGIGLSSAVSMICMLLGNVVLAIFAQRIFAGSNSSSLIAVPFFILAGNIINNGDTALRLVNYARVLGGKMSGSLVQADVIANMSFGAISGLDAATTAAIRSTMGPLKEKEGHGKNYSITVNATFAPVEMLIPPSNTMVVYPTVVGSVSVTALFMIGYIPGIIWGVGVITLTTTVAKRLGYRSSSELTLKIALKTFWQAVPNLLMIVITIGGILGDVSTTAEDSAVAIVYATVLSLICDSIKVKDIPRIALGSVKITDIITFMISSSSIMFWAMTFIGISSMVTTTILSVTSNKFLIFLLINVALLFVGVFIGPTPMILIFIPISLPIYISLEMSAVQFGIILCYNLSVGAITPSVGAALSIGCKVGGVTTEGVIRYLLPYFDIIIANLLLVIYIPVPSLGLLSLLGLI